jgi:MoxR-like ATPase
METMDAAPAERRLNKSVSEPRNSHDRLAALRTALNGVLLGKAEVIEWVLACLLARGHLLLEDRPGLGKTSLAKGLAAALGGRLSRVQCTPDLLPNDVTGYNLYNAKTHEFEFMPGPVFADVVLCDEINRATPRTQSALLEAMAERQVTVDGVRRSLAEHFFVVATQNPLDQHGTFPLPDAQLDRFAMKLSIGYPDRRHEAAMLEAAVGTLDRLSIDSGDAHFPFEELRSAQATVAAVYVAPEVQAYLLDLADATRIDTRIAQGISPRGVLVWQRVAQARAFLADRDFVTPDDVQASAGPVLGVRLASQQHEVARLVAEWLEKTPVPDATDADRSQRGFSWFRRQAK